MWQGGRHVEVICEKHGGLKYSLSYEITDGVWMAVARQENLVAYTER